MSSLKSLHVILMLLGGFALLVGLYVPWYYQSTAEGKYYEMNALGGSLIGFLENPFLEKGLPCVLFDLSIAYLSIVFALLSILFPLAIWQLAEKSQRKWLAIISLLGGVVVLTNIFYVHFWLGSYYTDGLLFYSDVNGSRGPLPGYFLAWFSVVMLFASTYTSKGLADIFPEKAKKAETAQRDKSTNKE